MKILFIFIFLNIFATTHNDGFIVYYSTDSIYTGHSKPIPIDSILYYPNIRYIGLHSTTPLAFSELKNTFEILSSLKKLKYLKLDNVIKDILPTEIQNIENLEQIDLSGNNSMNFGQVCTILSRMRKLRVLLLRYNDMGKIPVPICDIKSLEILDFAYSKLNSFPRCICKMPNLSTISFAMGNLNDIDAIINQLSQSQSLKKLNLAGLYLTKVPKNIDKIKNLKYIDLYGNRISKLPCSLSKKNINFNLMYNFNIIIPDCFNGEY